MIDDIETPSCSMCGGETYTLGQLGQAFWWRCRACGVDIVVNLDSAGGPGEVPALIGHVLAEAPTGDGNAS
jgi:tRNA(Ile2) C34 agmatinyltransferase TiaS